MRACNLPQNWDGTDVYVVGGGPSLRGFDWELLADKNTIGVNDAFRLGVRLCKVLFFSDYKWWLNNHQDIAAYQREGGYCASNSTSMLPVAGTSIAVFKRIAWGLYRGDSLGFGWNSGCGAVNLALSLGAKRVFLLGFDNGIPPGTVLKHWHDWGNNKMSDEIWLRQREGWKQLSLALPRVFPGCEVINLNPDSAIPYFPKQAIPEAVPA